MTESIWEKFRKIRDAFLSGSAANIKPEDVEEVLNAAEKFGLGLSTAAAYKTEEDLPQISIKDLRSLEHSLSPWEQKFAGGSILGEASVQAGLSPLWAIEGFGPQLAVTAIVSAAVMTRASQAAKISKNCGVFLETLKDLDASLSEVSDSLVKKNLVPNPKVVKAIWRILDLICHGGWLVQEFQKKNTFWRFLSRDDTKFRALEQKIKKAQEALLWNIGLCGLAGELYVQVRPREDQYVDESAKIRSALCKRAGLPVGEKEAQKALKIMQEQHPLQLLDMLDEGELGHDLHMALMQEVVSIMKAMGSRLQGVEAKVDHVWQALYGSGASSKQLEYLADGNNVIVPPEPKVFVGRTPFQANEADVRDLFIQYGEIGSCVVQRDGDGKSKGSAIVMYRTWTQAERAIEAEDGTMHLGGSRPMQVRFANANQNGIIAKTLWISEVPPALSEETFRATFAQFGNVAGLRMNNEGPGMGSAFVVFDRWSACEAAMAAFHEKMPLEGTYVPMKIRFAKPSPKASAHTPRIGAANQPSNSPMLPSSSPQAAQSYSPPNARVFDQPGSMTFDKLKALPIKELKEMSEKMSIQFPTGIEKEELASILEEELAKATVSTNSAAPQPSRAPPPPPPPPPMSKAPAPSLQQCPPPTLAVAMHSVEDGTHQHAVKVECDHGLIVIPRSSITQKSSIETLKEHLWEQTGLYPFEQRLTSGFGEDLKMYCDGKPQRLQDYGLASPDGPECKLRLDPLYSTSEGHSNLAREAARNDSIGLPPGKGLDLGLNGAFKGLEVGILQLYTGNGNAADFRLPQALEKKGFKVTCWSPDLLPGAWALEKFLDRKNVCQLWVISDSKRHLSDDMISVIKAHFDRGLGVYICGGNGAFNADANALGSTLLGATMDGNDHGGQTLTQEYMSNMKGYIENHALTTGIKKFFEGLKIASVAPFQGMQPIALSSAGEAVCAAYDKHGKRAVLDGGITRIFDAWKSDGTERFVRNAGVWLANYDTKGGLIVDRQYMLDTTPAGSIQWDQIQALKGISIQCRLIQSMEELKDMLFKGTPLPEETRRCMFLKVAPEPFSLAGLQLPYYARRVLEQGGLADQVLVAKQSRHTNSAFNNLPASQAIMETQAVAAFMSRQFNRVSGKQVRDVRIDAPRIFSPNDAIDGQWCSVEERDCFAYDNAIEGIPIEDSANEEDARDCAEVLQSFGHWTWIMSDGLLLVTEQDGSQGIYDLNRQYFLVDPAIHCKIGERFGKSNRGKAGIDQFFKSHVCSSLCQRLQLSEQRPAMS